jgi:hypothetical protein
MPTSIDPQPGILARFATALKRLLGMETNASIAGSAITALKTPGESS